MSIPYDWEESDFARAHTFPYTHTHTKAKTHYDTSVDLSSACVIITNTLDGLGVGPVCSDDRELIVIARCIDASF